MKPAEPAVEEAGEAPLPGPESLASGIPPDRLLRLAAIFYAVLFAAAFLWRSVLGGGSLLYAGPDAALEGVRLARDVGLGVGAGLLLVVASRVWTRTSVAGARLSASLRELLGPVSGPVALALAGMSGVAEEAFFRGALQPAVGWLAASLLFGLAHYVPRAGLKAWAPAAVLAGALLGGLYEWTGNLVAPALAHVVVNALNLRWLGRTEIEIPTPR